MRLSERERAATIAVYPQLDLTPVRADGVFIETADGRQLLDLYGGHAVAALGYGHPALTRAIAGQAATMLFQSNAVALAERAEAAEKLVAFAPDGLDRAFFVNSGGEANDNALRIACKVTGRRRVVALEHAFHGRTAAASAVTWGSRERWYGFPRTPFDVTFVPRDDAAAAVRAIGDDVAAVIVEPIQGVAGAYDLDPDYLRTLAAAAQEAGALLIADEVQSGMGRSGHAFAIEAAGVTPDILTGAKSLGGGVPCAAVLVSADLAGELKAGDLGSTFGGGPLAARAISTVIDTIGEQQLLAHVRRVSGEIRERCTAGPVQAIQGGGFMLGLVLDRPAAGVRDALLGRDILTGTSADPSVLRLLPPLILESSHVDRLATALAELE